METEQLADKTSYFARSQAREALDDETMLHMTLRRVVPEARWSYGVIERNTPIGTHDYPRYSTRFLVRIDDNYAADRIKLIGKTKSSRTGRGFMPRVYRPGRRHLQTPNASFVAGRMNTIEFDNPPREIVFEVQTAEVQHVEFDCKLS